MTTVSKGHNFNRAIEGHIIGGAFAFEGTLALRGTFVQRFLKRAGDSRAGQSEQNRLRTPPMKSFVGTTSSRDRQP